MPNRYGLRGFTATFAQVKAAFPDAVVNAVGVSQGSGVAGLVGGVDQLRVNGTTFDFENVAQSADLGVSVWAPQAAPGATVTAKITVTNAGRSPARDVSTALAVSGGGQVSTRDGVVFGQLTAFRTATLGVGQSVTYAVRLTVDRVPRGPLVLLASTRSSVPDPRPGNNTARTTVLAWPGPVVLPAPQPGPFPGQPAPFPGPRPGPQPAPLPGPRPGPQPAAQPAPLPGPQPAPQPAPLPGPRPGPQPAAQPAPLPGPQPGPRPGGQPAAQQNPAPAAAPHPRQPPPPPPHRRQPPHGTGRRTRSRGPRRRRPPHPPRPHRPQQPLGLHRSHRPRHPHHPPEPRRQPPSHPLPHPQPQRGARLSQRGARTRWPSSGGSTRAGTRSPRMGPRRCSHAHRPAGVGLPGACGR